jgi:PleD family two-component response regulator
MIVSRDWAAVDAGRKISVALNNALRDYPPVSASVGVAWFGEVDQPFPAMLKMADELMYEVKESGKGNMRSRRYTAADTPD